MQKIKLLPQNIVNQIAAGEVVERPLSVVKELIENAIDAGATEITLRIVDGGKNFISVEDNGSGMNKESLEMCILSHATSKLSSDNLFDVHTFGFRGEALPSIASISRLSITTSDNDSSEAWNLQMEGQETPKIIPAIRSRGTTIEVRDLFFATPARLKFLKSESYETEKCRMVFDDLALSNCSISFRFIDSGTEKAFYQKTDDLKTRIKDVFGDSFSKNTLALKAERDNFTLNGYIGVPTFNKSASAHQYFFVNNRLVKDKTFAAALRSAYAGLIPHGRYPVAILQLNMPFSDVDVNVHPAKTEVRFRDAEKVRHFLMSELKRRLSEDSNRASTEMVDRFYAAVAAESNMKAIPSGVNVCGKTSSREENEVISVLSNLSNNEAAEVSLSSKKTVNSDIDNFIDNFNSSSKYYATRPNSSSYSYARYNGSAASLTNSAKRSTCDFADDKREESVLPFPVKDTYTLKEQSPKTFVEELKLPEYSRKQELSDNSGISNYSINNCNNSSANVSVQKISLGNAMFQINNAYIVAENAVGIVIIDQHAAAERIMLEELKKSIKLSSQNLLISETVMLNASKIELLKSYNDLLTKLGLYLDYPSQDTVSVSAVPALLETADAESLLMDVVDELSAFGDAYTLDDKIHKILSTIACHSSLRAGKKLSVQEMNYFLRKMEDSSNVAQCCHGRPSYITLTIKDLNNFFERT